MRPVFVVSGGLSRFSKARPDKTLQAIVKEAHDTVLVELETEFPAFTEAVGVDQE